MAPDSRPSRATWARHARRGAALLGLSLASLQLVFAGRIALMGWVDPASTSFQRSEIWRLGTEKGEVRWAQTWVSDKQLSNHLKRAVMASEDAGFAQHTGIEWDALRAAWDKNQRAEEAADRRNARLAAQTRPGAAAAAVEPKLVGASTITQQLAKNLLLSGERTVARKAQELLLTWMLEAFLDKPRILTLYLNHVEWGEGLFGAQAAARYYFRTDAARLTPGQAATLAVMLPAPKRFERARQSPYLANRASVIRARMDSVALPD